MPKFKCHNCSKEYTAQFKQPPQGNSKRVNCPDCNSRIEEQDYLREQSELAAFVDTSSSAPSQREQPEEDEDDKDDD